MREPFELAGPHGASRLDHGLLARPVGTFAVVSRPSDTSTASVNALPTSMPRPATSQDVETDASACALLLIVLLAACGGDDEGAATGTTAGKPEATALITTAGDEVELSIEVADDEAERGRVDLRP